MEPTNQLQKNPESELSLKSIVLQLRGWCRFLLSKWLIIVVVGLVAAGAGAFYATRVRPNYEAKLTFVVEESKQGGLAGYAGLASQFGIDLGGGGSSGILSGDNILEFLRSRLIIEKTLLSTIDVNNRPVTLADYYLQHCIKPPVPAAALTFPLTQDRQHYSRLQDSVLFNIYETVLNVHLTVQKQDKKNSFIMVKCIAPDEVFSKVFSERLVNEAIDFYVATKTQNSQNNLIRLQKKADSLQILVNQKTYAVARGRDLNVNPARQIASVGLELTAMDKMLLQTMYAEVVKNLELTRMAVANETPVIQIVDAPIYPLVKRKLGMVKALVVAGVIGGLLCIILLMIRKSYRDLMN